MVFFGLVLLKVIPFSLFSLPSFGPDSFFRKIFPPLFQSRRMISRFALGLARIFPCMLSWAMVVKAATTQHPCRFFDHGLLRTRDGPRSIPDRPLCFSAIHEIRFLGERVAAVSVMAMGFILIFKGSKYFV